MVVISLQSGSNGNCIYVEVGDVRLLFDAGISGKQAQMRLAKFGRDINDVDALIISHDHCDHSRSAGIFHRKFGLSVYITPQTYEAASRYPLGEIVRPQFFMAGATLRFGDVRVETIPTPHDGADGVAFIVTDGKRRLGILTDLGCVFDNLRAAVNTLDAVIIESNYDKRMLEHGPYPAFLKKRIKGDGGHLSNTEAAELLAESAGGQLKWACLGHLSENNNTPERAMETHRKILGRSFDISNLHIADRYGAVGAFEL